MAKSLKDLMDDLGVDRLLGPYETYPWSIYDSGNDVTCSAEVRMGPEGESIEAEIQVMYDVPPEGKLPMEQICLIQMRLSGTDSWKIASFHVRREVYGKDIHNWEEKSCFFFRAVVQELASEKLPDFDEILKRELNKERGGDQRGSGGGRGFKSKGQSALMGMKKGGGGI